MDKKRIVSKIGELDNYLEELNGIRPDNFKEYKNSIEKRRACERLMQIAIEIVIDICNILVSELKLGLPSDEEDAFNKLNSKKIISSELYKIIIGMKSLRNILVHRYGIVNDEKVFKVISEKLEDFEKFKIEILQFLKK